MVLSGKMRLAFPDSGMSGKSMDIIAVCSVISSTKIIVRSAILSCTVSKIFRISGQILAFDRGLHLTH